MKSAQALILGSLFALIVGCSEASNSPEVLIERARLRERQGKLEEAIEAYTAVIQQRPKEAMLHYDRGVAFGQLGQFDLAINDYTTAIELDPSLARAFNNRAVAHAHLKNYELAIKDCDRAIDLEPNDALAYRNRGLVFHDLSQFDKALADYDTSIRNDGRSASSYFHRGNVYLETKKFARAIEDFDQTLRLDSKYANALQNRAVAFAALGQRDKAEQDFAAASRLDPKLKPEWPAEVAATVVALSKTGIQQVAAAELKPPNSEQRNQAMRQRAIVATAAHLESAGYQVERLADSESWPLRANKADAQFLVLIKLAETDEADSVELSHTEIEAARNSAVPVHLAIVTGIAVSDSSNSSAGGGTVKLLSDRDWLRDEHLTPIRFRLSTNGLKAQ